jgi:hypothetical protein
MITATENKLIAAADAARAEWKRTGNESDRLAWMAARRRLFNYLTA